MSQDLRNQPYELNRLHNPWEKFKSRDPNRHKADDDLTFRLGRPPFQLDPHTPVTILPLRTTEEAINIFLKHRSLRLDDAVPLQKQLLKDFLQFGKPSLPTSQGAPNNNYLDDVRTYSSTEDIALIDDRNNHDRCARSIGKDCDDCYIYSEKISMPDLCTRLRNERKTTQGNADRRVLFMPNITPAGALVLAATCAQRSAVPLRNFLHRYLSREHIFSAYTSWGFFLEFHIPYHAMRYGPIHTTKDPRRVSGKQNSHGKRLRKSSVLPLQLHSDDQKELYYHEAQTSSLCWGPDETFWTELFLVDTYFGSEKNLQTYLSTPHRGKYGDGSDPPLAGRGSMEVAMFDPREYFLLKIDHRMEQVATEYGALVETFNKRMDAYGRKIRKVFVDDPQRTNTETLSNVIETIHVFVDCLGGIIDAWDTFSRTEIALFTTHAPDKLKWPEILSRITRSMSELDRLRRVLIMKRERFRFSLERLHTVSSLSQTETANLQATTAVSQGEDLKVLTQMTVYVAFPLLFTTAFFSMDFATPPYPWAVFFCILLLVSLVNYMIASQSSPKKTCKEIWTICKTAWKELWTWSKDKIS